MDNGIVQRAWVGLQKGQREPILLLQDICSAAAIKARAAPGFPETQEGWKGPVRENKGRGPT